ncbi:hypothetical protein GWI33_001856 [Rhynchophorus ferrugineus]|uniref:Fatty acid desaturase domain-containing protein n=1 Tax=Rhynchophorus ferrugineus TaxID=354439 RepID=A0A834ISA2_RHYFE|nr:hypothetical protein GWI33_001856 [Rhynchophorus ferrugineus]
MAPNAILMPTGVLNENDDEVCSTVPSTQENKSQQRKIEVVWTNVTIYIFLLLTALCGLVLTFTSARLYTTIYAVILYHLSCLGITAGAHRLWSHRSYKVKWPLKIILVICNTLAHENSIIVWARDHRVHHKYSDTDADPHNAKRGFFFSHVGWLLCKKHPEVKSKGKLLDISDLYTDPIVYFQHKYYMILMPLICFILPTYFPMVLWNETLRNSFCLNILRYVCSLNAAWSINSLAHMWGNKPYDKSIVPVENKIVSIIALGEGWHNYHHAFPWDYKTSELGKYSTNFSTLVIDGFAKIGWAYDLKTVSAEMVQKRVQRTGDGSHNIWGWGDKDQPKEDYEKVKIIHRKTT